MLKEYLLGPVLKRCAKRFSACLRLGRTDLYMTCGAMTVILVIYTVMNVTGDALDHTL